MSYIYTIVQCAFSKEDEKWLDEIDQIKDDEDGYKLLVEKMGIFRWQSAHGFRTGQNRGLAHLKPIFKNIKELRVRTESHGDPGLY